MKGFGEPELNLARQVCWNCRGSGHIFQHCPLPRNRLQIRASRNNFRAARDAMPEHAIPYLPAYSRSTGAETKARRMQLLDRFQPGRVSEDLAEAVWWIQDEEDEDEEERVELEVRRRKSQWPWLLGMVRWGYPPGWIAGKGEFMASVWMIVDINSPCRS